jgi:hypothetical protein
MDSLVIPAGDVIENNGRRHRSRPRILHKRPDGSAADIDALVRWQNIVH